MSPTVGRAVTTPPLLEVFLDDPEIQADHVISDFGDHEELKFTSNLFLLQRQEFGRYVRKTTDLSVRIEQLANSIAGTGFKPPRDRTIVWPNSHWHVIIKGEEIDPIDPRFDAAVKLIREQVGQVGSAGWRRKQVAVVELKKRRFQVSVSQLEYSEKQSPLHRPHVTRQVFHPLELCKDVFENHLVCRVPHGVVLLREQDEPQPPAPSPDP